MEVSKEAVRAGSFVAGSLAGILIDLAVGEGFKAAKIPNPAWETIQTHNVLLMIAEGLGALGAYERGITVVGDFLAGALSAVAATDLYEYTRRFVAPASESVPEYVVRKGFSVRAERP